MPCRFVVNIEWNFVCCRFILQLVANSNSAILNIIETNPFKHLVHLALKFLPGTDCEVKKYLADCLKLAKVSKYLLDILYYLLASKYFLDIVCGHLLASSNSHVFKLQYFL